MAQKDTKRIEALLKLTQESIALVREELVDGASLQHVYDELNAHERFYAFRLNEITEWNKSQAAQARLAEDAEKAKSTSEIVDSGTSSPSVDDLQALPLAEPMKLNQADAGQSQILES